MLYVAVDIGCIECGEHTSVLGIFTEREKADAVCDEHYKRQKENWHGQHLFEVFEVSAIDEIERVEYE